MSFGFSIGDFLTVGRLVATVIDALNSSSGSSESYQELVSELFSFQRALLEAEEVCRSSSQLHVATINAIKHSVALCRRPIEVFLAKIVKYRCGLNSSSWRKIGWALFKEEEVRKLRCILKMHINCVNLLVVTAGA
jgi:hypothetical protein